jgi:hypothetical protein
MKGRLHYLAWDRPWTLVEDDGQLVDLEPLFWDFAEAHRGSAAVLPMGPDGIALSLDPLSNRVIHFDQRGAGILLSGQRFDFQNVAAYLAMALERLNGRQVKVRVEPHAFTIEADPAEPVPQVFYSRDNYGRVPAGEETSRCKAGQGDECCIFLIAGGEGFECAKFSALSRVLLDRHAKGEMRAGRIGNCRLAGREIDR